MREHKSEFSQYQKRETDTNAEASMFDLGDSVISEERLMMNLDSIASIRPKYILGSVIVNLRSTLLSHRQFSQFQVSRIVSEGGGSILGYNTFL